MSSDLFLWSGDIEDNLNCRIDNPDDHRPITLVGHVVDQNDALDKDIQVTVGLDNGSTIGLRDHMSQIAMGRSRRRNTNG